MNKIVKNSSIFITLSLIFFLPGCSNLSKSDNKQQEKNSELSKAAEEGKTFHEHNLIVITENGIRLTSVLPNSDTISQIVNRGCVLQMKPFAPSPQNYRSVNFPGDSIEWFLPTQAPFFQQYEAGMRFPIVGKVTNKNSHLRYYDNEKNTQYDLELEEGENYFWIIRKGEHYINILRDSSGHSITGAYSEKNCLILHRKEHLTIVSKQVAEKLMNALAE